MTPAELIHAILLAPVDLLWNGGIGTYVKADRDQRRRSVTGQRRDPGRRPEVRCKVVGEGGNLG
jgi:glutamate dehydrogenase